ncbi:hypothetical protein [uncultured Paludibaculum sp.]|uniref:hypothetical protein n=1 Tax=uncultured Paludibaculum sp. TaxID=1765020 RepID=UPI002AAB6386|nr:hypothetical protein [uncultured Paludibaculum sp.]
MIRQHERRSGTSTLSLALACAALFGAPQFLSGATPPVISGYAPAATVSVVDLQTTTVLGSGFQRGLTVKLSDPSGRTSTVNPSRVTQVTANSFQFQSRFPAPGAYQMQVTNPDGASSEPFNVQVTERPEPTITAVSPATIFVGSKEQTLTIVGSGFRAGLSVYVSLPGGGNDFAQNLRVTNLTATQFDMQLVLDRLGQYSLWVTDPDGVQSKSVTFNVTRQQGAVQITDTKPNTPVMSADLQLIHVVGVGFQPGLAATLTKPSAGTVVLAGAGRVQAVTSSGFDMFATFPEPGIYFLKVANPDGGQSAAFAFEVGSAPIPEITGTLPSPTVASPESVTLDVLGSGFGDGVILYILRPDGGLSVLTNSQIVSSSDSEFKAVYSFTTPGDYTLQVENLSGARSKVYTLHVSSVSTAPIIQAYSPLVLPQTAQLQTLSVQGQNFQPGLKAVWTTPHGATVPADSIDAASVLPTTFPVTGAFGEPGTYLLQVINPDLSKSDYFPIRVTTPGPSSPVITGHSPSPIAASPNVRALLVRGGDFISGLSATLILPDTTPVSFSPDQIQGTTFSSFIINTDFAQPGDYTLQIQNPDGIPSNVYTFTVDPPPPSPTVSSVAPDPIRIAPQGQTLSVGGSGFLPGLAVHVTVHPPMGTPSTFAVDPGQVRHVSASNVLVTISLPNPWTYDLQVDNPDGTQSNVFSFSVLPEMSIPIIDGYVATPTFYLTGVNFLDGLSASIWTPTNAPYQLNGLTPDCADDAEGQSRCTLALPVTLADRGIYRFRIFNPDGGLSATFEINY